MAMQKASDRMNELIRSLQQAMARLELGKLGLDELEQATLNAQAIYERFVVLRHKGREAAVLSARPQAPEAPVPPPPATVDEAMPPLRLDTRPHDVSPQQTSLIDAIAETENPPPAPPKPAAEAPPPKPKPVARKEAERVLTVADKMGHAPVQDLAKAISLSQKFWFVTELFGGDRKRYDETLQALNAKASLEEAMEYMRDEVTAKLATPPGEEVTATFNELLQRRFQ